jgi:hypothetical protein
MFAGDRITSNRATGSTRDAPRTEYLCKGRVSRGEVKIVLFRRNLLEVGVES